MNKMKKFVAVFLSLALGFTFTAPAVSHALDNNTSNSIVYDESGIPYKIISENDALYITRLYTPRMGGGLGKCPSKEKVFKEKVTRKSAVQTLDAMNKGSSAIDWFSILASTTPIGIVATLVNKGMAKNIERTTLENFVNSSHDVAYLTYYTRCSQHKMYGETTYDYSIVSVSLTY
ncbi:MAG: hypothetical protein KHY76_05005 [Butyricicoccus pullicaecorum]|nr:hypothetical protein [Butyricicoccus pullicaecorum]